MSAIGLYASEEEFQNMINEIRYSNFVFTGILQDGVTIEELIMLYVNHRPIEALIEDDVRNAFNLICSRYESLETLNRYLHELRFVDGMVLLR